MANKCDATITFADDYGDNDCTFHCGLEEGHSCKHKESGAMEGQKYILSWEE